jgi:hypothetical protein
MTSKLPVELIGGSGTSGQVLTSNGPSSSPSMQDLNAVQTDQVSNFTKQQYFGATSLTIGAGNSIAWNVENEQVTEVELTVNATLENPTNPQAGGIYHILVKQDTTGGWTLTFGSNFKFAGGTPPTITTTAERADIYSFYYNGTYMLEMNRTQDLNIFVPIPVPDLDLSTYSYTTNSFSTSPTETIGWGCAWGDSGNKLYVVGWVADGITQYNASSPYDITTLSLASSQNVGIAGPRDLAWNPDGTQFFIGNTTSTVKAFTCSTPWDISTWAADTGKDFDAVAQESAAAAIDFNADGTKMFIAGSGSDAINEYSLSSAYNPSTATFTTSFSLTTQFSNPFNMQFTNDGESLIIAPGGLIAYQYDFTTGYDLTTIAFNQSVSFSPNRADGIAMSPDNSVLILYDTITDSFKEFT